MVKLRKGADLGYKLKFLIYKLEVLAVHLDESVHQAIETVRWKDEGKWSGKRDCNIIYVEIFVEAMKIS